MSGARPEVWLRGPVEGVPAPLQPAAHAILQAREELHRAVAGLDDALLWARPGGAAAVGFHLRHVAGVVDRLLAYAEGRALDDAQRAALAAEGEPGATAAELLALVDAAVDRAVAAYRAADPATLHAPRAVGRAGLPSTVLGLLFHAAEHAQRHAGQAGTTATVVRGLYPGAAPDRAHDIAAADVSTVRAVYDAWARGDGEFVLAHVDPDVELVESPLLPWGGVHAGAAGVRRFLGTRGAHVDALFEVERLVPAGDRVVSIGRSRGTVRSGGAAFDVPAVHVWTLRDGRILRVEAYVDTPAMLAALGPR